MLRYYTRLNQESIASIKSVVIAAICTWLQQIAIFGFEIRIKTTHLAVLGQSNLPLGLIEIVLC